MFSKLSEEKSRNYALTANIMLMLGKLDARFTLPSCGSVESYAAKHVNVDKLFD